MYTDHTLPSDTVMTVDAYEGDGHNINLTYDIKRKNEMADLEK